MKNEAENVIQINSDWKFRLDQSESGLIRIENCIRIENSF